MKTAGDLDDIESFFAEDMPNKPELLKQLKALKYPQDIESSD
jgi:hypothetical protein